MADAGVFSADEGFLQRVAGDWNKQAESAGAGDIAHFSVSTSAGESRLTVSPIPDSALKDLPIWMEAVVPMLTGSSGVRITIHEVADDAPGLVPVPSGDSGGVPKMVSMREAAPNGEGGMFVPSVGLVRAASRARSASVLDFYGSWRASLGPDALDPSVVGADMVPPAPASVAPILETIILQKMRGSSAASPGAALSADVFVPNSVRSGSFFPVAGDPNPATEGEVVAHELALHGTQFSPGSLSALLSRPMSGGGHAQILGPSFANPNALQGLAEGGTPLSGSLSNALQRYSLDTYWPTLGKDDSHSALLYSWGYRR